eukprot:6551383-Prymnesium_polylepis.1
MHGPRNALFLKTKCAFAEKLATHTRFEANQQPRAPITSVTSRGRVLAGRSLLISRTSCRQRGLARHGGAYTTQSDAQHTHPITEPPSERCQFRFVQPGHAT